MWWLALGNLGARLACLALTFSLPLAGGVYAMRVLGNDHLHKFGATAVRYYIPPASIGSAETFSPEFK